MDGSQPKYGLHDSIGHHISRSARIVERRVEESLRKHGLTRVGWCILLAVEEDGQKNPSEIAGFVGIDRTATSRALRQLESEGLISRAMGVEDRRTTEVSLTEEGRARMLKAMPLCSENMSHFASKLTASEEAQLKALLQRLTEGEDA